MTEKTYEVPLTKQQLIDLRDKLEDYMLPDRIEKGKIVLELDSYLLDEETKRLIGGVYLLEGEDPPTKIEVVT